MSTTSSTAHHDEHVRTPISLPFIDISQHLVFFGVASIAISLATWAVDLLQWTYPCPYCRAQRTVIGLLGVVILLLPYLNTFIARYLSVAVGGFGFGVAVMQHFSRGWQLMFRGEYQMRDPWFMDGWILSACAMLIMAVMAGQLGIIFEARVRKTP